MRQMRLHEVTHKDSPRHWLFFFALLGFFLPLIGILLYLIQVTNDIALRDSDRGMNDGTLGTTAPAPFPVGVDPIGRSIEELPHVESFLENELDSEVALKKQHSPLVEKAVAKLSLFSWYQSLAAGASRVLIIEPGERKEQIAMNFGKILNWTEDEQREFIAAIVASDPVLLEGKFAPGSYVVAQEATPSEIAPLIVNRFNETVMRRYPADVTRKVPLHDALTIASLLEREAYDFEDMRHIAGVIWNRLFIDMNLQIDATLQYARGTDAPKTWWPKPVPDDKYIDSLYNTYEHKGLPPTPIANPSVDAILAALNPRETDCMYYFHDKEGDFHCAKTYEEHVSLLKEYYGRGK